MMLLSRTTDSTKENNPDTGSFDHQSVPSLFNLEMAFATKFTHFAMRITN